MRVLSLGTLQSRLLKQLSVNIPVEVSAQVSRITFGERGCTGFEQWLAEITGAPVKLDIEIFVKPLPNDFRNSDFFEVKPVQVTEAAIPAAILGAMTRTAGVSNPVSVDVMITGYETADKYLLATAPNEWTDVSKIAQEVGATFLGPEGTSLSVGSLLHSAFSGKQETLALAALEVMLATRDRRLQGQAIESCQKLNDRLISGAGFDDLSTNLQKQIDRFPEFLRFMFDLVRFQADLSKSQSTDASMVLALFDEAVLETYGVKYPIILAQFYIDFARYFQDIRGIELADKIFSRLSSLKPMLDEVGLESDLLFLADHRIGRSQYLRGNFVEALRHYRNALQSLNRLDSGPTNVVVPEIVRLTKAEILNSAGKAFNDLLDLQRAIELFKEAVTLRRFLDANTAKAATFGSIAETLERADHYQPAKICFEKDLALCEPKDKLRVQSYLALLKILGNPPDVIEAEKEFEALYAEYKKHEDLAQASYGAVGLAMCAFRQSDSKRIEEIWKEWNGKGEALPRGFISFLNGVLRAREWMWDEAIEHIRRSASIFSSDGYLLEAAAASLELLVVAMQAKQIKETAKHQEVDASTVPRFVPSVLAQEGLTETVNFIERFQPQQEQARGIQWPATSIVLEEPFPELEGLQFLDSAELMAMIQQHLDEIKPGTESPETLNVTVIRQIQRQLHFWFDILSTKAWLPGNVA